MRKGTLRTLVDQHLQESGDNKQLGFLKASEHITTLLEEKKLKPEDFSIFTLFEELVDPEGRFSRTAEATQLVEAIVTSAFPTISKVIINKSILDAYNLAVGDAANLVTEDNASRTTTDTMAGFTAGEGLEYRPEGMAYEETFFGEKDYGVIMGDFGRIISLTREAIFDDRTGQLLSRAKDIGEKGGQHRAKMIIQTLEVSPRTAFKEKASASKAFIYKGAAKQFATVYNATTHATIDGQLNPNLVATNTLVDWTDIDAALQLFDAMVDEAGDAIEITPTGILVPSALRTKLWLITNTAQTLAKGSTDLLNINTANPYGPQGMQDYEKYTSRYLTSDSSWFVGDFRKQLVWLWVFKPATAVQTADSESAFTNQIVMRYRFNYHGGCGHKDYRYIVKNTA